MSLHYLLGWQVILVKKLHEIKAPPLNIIMNNFPLSIVSMKRLIHNTLCTLEI